MSVSEKGRIGRYLQGWSLRVDRGMVLVIEDEPLIRELIEETLTNAGYRAAGIGGGGEAMLLLDHPPDGVTAIVCDIRLGGGISGWVVARHAREMMPEVGVVYISGDNQIDWKPHAVPGSRFLAKPFNGLAIAALVNEVAIKYPGN